MSGIDKNIENQIKELIHSGNKIAAIKRYRESTGASLVDAKNAVDAIALGKSVDLAYADSARLPPAQEELIKRLLRQNNKIEAIKLYRAALHCGLKDAKDAVDEIQAQLRREVSESESMLKRASNDPFEAEETRARNILILGLALALIIIGGVLFFLLSGNGF